MFKKSGRSISAGWAWQSYVTKIQLEDILMSDMKNKLSGHELTKNLYDGPEIRRDHAKKENTNAGET